MPQIYTQAEIMPTAADVEKLITAKISYEAAQAKPTAEKDAWNKKNFVQTPWGIAYTLSKKKFEQQKNYANARGWNLHNGHKPQPKTDILLRYFIIAVAINWTELIDQLKRTLKNWGYTTADLKQMATDVWQDPNNANTIAALVNSASGSSKIKLIEAVEKHDTLNPKLFTKDGELKENVRKKMLEIVDEFLADLKEQDIKIKVTDILLIGSNASYNYTKDSDIDLHILADTRATKYSKEVGQALYSAYRSLFNKQLDISIYDIPLELFVETEDSPRVSNGVYSVKKDKWVKEPVIEDIPDYDKDALDALVEKWEEKCVALIDDIKADKLENEDKVVKLLEDIYEKLRKKGIAKGEYSVENLAFKELRNKGYLDQLKQYKHDLVSKRLSLTERMSQQNRRAAYEQIARIAGTQPIIQDNGIFFLYNLKAREVHRIVRDLERLDIVENVHAFDNGKYDFSRMAMDQVPSKYYDVRGTLKLNFM